MAVSRRRIVRAAQQLQGALRPPIRLQSLVVAATIALEVLVSLMENE